MYKTNLPSGNSMYFSSGTLATIGNPGVRGTWSVTFNPFSDIVLTSPAGTTTNFTIPADALTLFAGPLSAYFGVQPNAVGNIGQSAIFSRIQITGLQTPIDETFAASPLNNATWEVVAENAPGIVPVPPDTLFWLNWTLPDRDFGLQVRPSLSSPWSDLPLLGTQISSLKRLVVRPADLPASASGHYFFHLKKP